MDAIDAAIEKKRNISIYPEYNNQTWDDFYRAATENNVFLVGVGNAAGIFWERIKDISLEGIIDNDIKKQNIEGQIEIDVISKIERKLPLIQSVDLLKGYNSDNITVLITSLLHYDEIIDQIKALGISSIYILLIMEANKRKMEQNKIEESLFEKYANEPINENKVFFQGYGPYSDHVRYIAEKLASISPLIEIVWAVNKYVPEMPKTFRQILIRNQRQYAYEIETSKVIVYNHELAKGEIKRDNQIHIHTKHWASITLKKFYLDSVYTTDSQDDIARWRKLFSELDYIFIGSKFDEESSARGFNFRKEFVRVGSPRSDIMFRSEDYKEKIILDYNLNKYDKFALYAPTYRFNNNNGFDRHKSAIPSLPDFERVKRALDLRFGGNWCILFRAHPAFADLVNELELPECVYDVSDREDGEELCAASDVMISDYSSIIFEMAFVIKPVFLYAPDKRNYIDNEYDLLIEYDSLPFPIALNDEELEEEICCFDKNDYVKEVNEFLEKYGVNEDGHASERAAQFIIDLLQK